MQDSESGELFRVPVGTIEERLVDTDPRTAKADDDFKEMENLGKEMVELCTKLVKDYAKRKGYILEFRYRFEEVNDVEGKSKLVIDAVVKLPGGVSDLLLELHTFTKAVVGILLERLDVLTDKLNRCVDLESDDDNKVDGELLAICPISRPGNSLSGCIGLEVPNHVTAQCIRYVSRSEWLHKGFVVRIQDSVFEMPNVQFLADGGRSPSRETQDLTLAIGECISTGSGVILRQSTDSDNRASAFTTEASGVRLPRRFSAQVRMAADGRLGPAWNASIDLRTLVGTRVVCRLRNFYDRIVLPTQRPRFTICEEILRVVEGERTPIQDDILSAYG